MFIRICPQGFPRPSCPELRRRRHHIAGSVPTTKPHKQHKRKSSSLQSRSHLLK
ncbi:hypothetical protein K438DRAFT_1800838 [Mycena galopus ATCC 62051]|nr:hypothetical protein K438DRAFT_1800838 [Mycena galopus ATCC 62051]